MTVLAERGVQPDSAHVHCGFDGGQGILKVAISVTERGQDDQNQGRSKYIEVC